MNHDALEVRFLTAEAAAIDADEMRFDPPVSPDIAAQVNAHLEIAIGHQILRAQAIASLTDALLAEFWEVDAIITAMRFEQRRARAECYKDEETA